MVQVTVDTRVTVAGGPALLSRGIIPTGSYAAAQLTLTAENEEKPPANQGNAPTVTPVVVRLIPAGSQPVLLALRAYTPDGGPSVVNIRFVAEEGTQTTPMVWVKGSLLVASKDVLGLLLTDAARTLHVSAPAATFTDSSPASVTVDVIAAFEA